MRANFLYVLSLERCSGTGIAPVLKTGVLNRTRRFESCPFRQKCSPFAKLVKATGFDPVIRRFKSFMGCQKCGHSSMVEFWVSTPTIAVRIRLLIPIDNIAKLVKARNCKFRTPSSILGVVSKWECRIVAITVDCKSAPERVRRFESFRSHH